MKVVTKRGKPYQSSLSQYESEVRALKESGLSLRAIAAEMQTRHALTISHNAVASFLRTHESRRRHFFADIPSARRIELMKALKALWTHDSTAIEGNTLTLGDTMLVLEYGLTVKGKPLKDQLDVSAHGRAVDFIQKLAEKGCVTLQDLFHLHELTVPVETADIYRPVGAWKREDNGTYGVERGKTIYMPYAAADETPQLMSAWLKDFNLLFRDEVDAELALEAYVRAHVSFVRIHPFFDGNGRLARLLSNLPVLFAGHPPIVISSEARQDYISSLWEYQRKVGVISRSSPELLPCSESLEDFRQLVRASWRTTLDLVAEARERHSKSR